MYLNKHVYYKVYYKQTLKGGCCPDVSAAQGRVGLRLLGMSTNAYTVVTVMAFK
jgi:hypothetical protein